MAGIIALPLALGPELSLALAIDLEMGLAAGVIMAPGMVWMTETKMALAGIKDE